MRINSNTTYLVAFPISTATVPSPAETVIHCLNFCIHADISNASGLNATFKLQGRVGQRQFADIAGATQAVTSNGSAVFNQNSVAYDQVRLVMVVTAGTATVDADFRKKEVPA